MTRSSSDFSLEMYNLVKSLAHPAGFEPTACRLGGGRSILLSYGCKTLNSICFEAAFVNLKSQNRLDHGIQTDYVIKQHTLLNNRSPAQKLTDYYFPNIAVLFCFPKVPPSSLSTPFRAKAMAAMKTASRFSSYVQIRQKPGTAIIFMTLCASASFSWTYLAAGFDNRDFLAVAQDAVMWPDGRFLALRLSADAVLLQTLPLPAAGSVFP